MTATTVVRRYLADDGVALTADVGGDPAAPAVILSHGGGQTRHSWGTAMARLLADGYQVINVDARGHGESDWSPISDYRIERLAADLQTIVRTLPSPPALVGASMGGAASLIAAAELGAASALVLVDVVPRLNPEGAERIIAFMRARPDGFATLEEVADAVAAYYPQRRRPRDPSGLMKNLRKRADGRLHWHWDPAFVANAQVVSEPPRFTERLYEAAARVRVPTLLVRGMESDIVSEDSIAEFRIHLPALEVCDVAAAGHMVAGDRNDAFNDGVSGFLRRHLPSPQPR
ncbi:alpha/beta fold hydrolase [Nevskia ramosa]|uniref:alpha/beta fold hydrolase n=1 Tax=Nevskia ramosa TaxID=64002 RepID=UPI0003B787D8|nr:alpha/beta hydrolase [Nevskia ramosa]